MNRKFLIRGMILICILLLTLCACSSKQKKTENDTDQSKVETSDSAAKNADQKEEIESDSDDISDDINDSDESENTSSQEDTSATEDSESDEKSDEPFIESGKYKFYVDKKDINNKEGKEDIKPETPKKEGYVFMGWRESEEDEDNDSVNLYPHFVPVEGPTLVVDTGYVMVENDEVEIAISLIDNPGVSSIATVISYPDALELLDVSYDERGQSVKPQNMDSPVKLNWLSPFENIEGDFVYATLTFKINDKTEDGIYPITITYNEDDIYNMDEDNITCKCVDGSIIVTK